jgi:CcmD family protein
MENLNWLFGAYGIAFLLLFGYLFQIGRRESDLRHRISNLQATVEERWKK